MLVDVEALSRPVKVIDSDPVMPHSYMPTAAMGEILALDYDFIPDITHCLQLEEPEAWVSAMLRLKAKDGDWHLPLSANLNKKRY